MESLLRDLRYGFRMLLRAPAFTVIAVLTLALGIGGNTALFSVVRAALLTPVAIPEPDRAVMVWTEAPKRGWHQFPASPPDFRDWQQSGVFSHLASFRDQGFNLRAGDRTERVDGLLVSGDMFEVLGRKPEFGRLLQADDEQPGRDQAIVLSYQFWRSQFGGDPNVVGRSVVLDGTPRTVVGVTPKNFPSFGQEKIYSPLVLPADRAADRGSRFLGVVGRLAPGLTLPAAQQRMQELSARLSTQYPAADGELTAQLQPLAQAYVQDVRTLLLVLLGAVGFVLLIACANVANLLLARGTARAREMAVRTALGASRWSLVRQLLTESVLLAFAGGVVGVVPAAWGMDFVTSFGLDSLPHVDMVKVDTPVLLFNLGLSVATGLLFGLAPAWRTWRTDVNSQLKLSERSQGSPAHQRLRALFVVSEIALTVVLLVGAGLTVQNLLRLRLSNPGYNPNNALTFHVALADKKYAKPEQQIAFYEEMLRRVHALPGVRAAGAVDDLPTSDSIHGTGIYFAGQPEPKMSDVPIVLINSVTPGYFSAMQVPLVRGRLFTDEDRTNSPLVTIIDQWTAQRYWPGEDAIGKQVKLGRSEPWRQVVGVVGNVQQGVLIRVLKGQIGQVYRPEMQAAMPGMTIVARTAGDPTALAGPIRNVAREIDVDQPIFAVQTLEAARAVNTVPERLTTLLLSAFAGLALLLAATGIYGVVSYAVAQRTHEIGIRMALGAQRREVLGMVLRQGLLLAAIGAATGLAGAFALVRVLSSLLLGIRPTDPVTFAGVTLVVGGSALLASYLPARRATHIDPIAALRYE